MVPMAVSAVPSPISAAQIISPMVKRNDAKERMFKGENKYDGTRTLGLSGFLLKVLLTCCIVVLRRGGAGSGPFSTAAMSTLVVVDLSVGLSS